MATGAIRQAEENLRITLADCATWQSIATAIDRTEALRRIHLYALPPPLDGRAHTIEELKALRPFAIVRTAGERGFVSRWSATETYEESGRLLLTIERNTPGALEADPAGRLTTFLDVIGAIESEMRVFSNSAGLDSYLRIETFQLQTFGLSDETEREAIGDFEIAEIEITWGTGGG